MYTKTNWVDKETLVNAENMNKIETALEKHEKDIEDKLNKPKVDGTTGQILARKEDGSLEYIEKSKDGKRGSVWTVGTALSGEASDKAFSSSGLENSLIGDMYLNSTSFEVYKCTKDGNASVATWTKVGVIKGTDGKTPQQLDHINNATGSSDAHTVLNSLLAGLIAKGYMKAS